jgi:hypothetical protein
VEEEEEEGKNGEWIWLWDALTASVLGALCAALARAIHDAGKKVGSGRPVVNLGVIPAQRGLSSMRKTRNSSARCTGKEPLFVLSDGQVT